MKPSSNDAIRWICASAISTGDFWVTAERLQLGAIFILPFGNDEFYLITKSTDKRITFAEELAKVRSMLGWSVNLLQGDNLPAAMKSACECMRS